MGNDTQYRHYHEKSSKWFRELFIDYTKGSNKGRDVHHHKIIDKSSGVTGEGFGWSYQDAEKKAWDDLRTREDVRPGV
jgi:hypothetical protein